MKIALFLYSLGPGGAERQASLLAKELSKEYEVEMVLVHDHIFYDLPKNVNVHILDDAPLFLHPIKKFLKIFPLAKRFAAFCKERNINVVISFMNRPNYIVTLSKFFGNSAKIVVSERGSPSYYYRGLEGVVSKGLIRYLYPKADLVVTNSLGNAKDLTENFGVANTRTIYNMFDLETINRLSKEKIGVPKRRFTFGTVGRLDRGKNHRLLIEALHKAKIEADLWIIGEGPLEEELRNLVDRLGLSESVRLLGRQRNPFAFMAKCDAFVFGSTNEGFPNVLVEALACGLPVLSTDCPSGPAEILQKEFGILVPNEDVDAMSEAMRKIFFDESLRKEFAQRSHTRAEDFSIERIVPRWKEVIVE